MNPKIAEERRQVWSRADWNSIRNHVRQQDWRELLRKKTVTDAWQHLTDTLAETVKKYVPTARTKNKTQPKWMNRELLKLIRQKHNAWKSFKCHGSLENLENYKKLEREMANKIKNAKRGLEREIAATRDKNNKKFTSYIKSKTKSRTSVGPLKNTNGETLTEDKDMADHLNRFFTSVFTRNTGETVPEIENETDKTLENIDITRKKTRKIIKDLRL